MSSAGRPDLDADTLWLERAVLVGDALSQMFFGMVVFVFLKIMRTLLPETKNPRQWPLIAYTFLMFMLGTVFIEMDLHSLQLMFIDHREFKGGPTAYALSQYGKPITVIPNVCAIVSDWMAAGLLLYRCVMVFQLQLYIIVLPILMFLGMISMGCMVLFQSSRPNAHLWTKITVDFGLPYFSLSAALNVTLTVMISVRLLIHRHSIKRVMGSEQAASIPYTSIIAMLIESSAMYAIASVLFIVPYGLGSHVSNIFLPNMTMIQILAPFLIILRVAKKQAWEAGTSKKVLSSIHFDNGTTANITSRDETHLSRSSIHFDNDTTANITLRDETHLSHLKDESEMQLKHSIHLQVV